MVKAKAILIILLITYIQGYAQRSITLSGVVRDSTGKGLPKATIQIINRTDSLNTISREDGIFTFDVSAGRRFEIRVSIEGFYPFQSVVEVPAGVHVFTFPPILLRPNYKELAPAMVTGIRPIKVREDTVEYYAGAFNIRPEDELEILLKKFPGLHVLADGTVNFQGKKIAKIRVNGRDFVGGDIATAIRNMPADMVESIQLIDDYGDKGRLTGVKSGVAEKVLNVVLKEDRRNGLFGTLAGSAGSKDKYGTGLFVEAIKNERQLNINAWLNDTLPIGKMLQNGVHLGYSNRWDKALSLSSTLEVGGDSHSAESSMSQINILSGTESQLLQNNKNIGNDWYGRTDFTLLYEPDQNTRLRITPAFNVSHSVQNTYTNASTVESDGGFKKTTSDNDISVEHDKNSTAGVDLYFEKIYSKSRLSFTGSYHSLNKAQDQDQLTNTYAFADSLNTFSRQHYLLSTVLSSQDWLGDLSYYLPVQKTAFLELGISEHYMFTHSAQNTQEVDSIGHQAPIDSLDNTFVFKSLVQRVHAGYLAHSKKVNVTVGLDAQPGSQTGQLAGKESVLRYHYFSLLPMAELAYAISGPSKFGLRYTTDSRAPEFYQLQPATNFSNPQYPVTGNPLLKRSYNQTLDLYYEQPSTKPWKYPSFGANLDYANTKDMVIADAVYPHDTSNIVQRTMYVNANGSHSASASFHIDLPTFFHKHLRISTSGSFGAGQTVTMVDDVLHRTHSLNWAQGLNIDLDVPNVVEADIAASYAHIYTPDPGGGSPPVSATSADWSFSSHFYFRQKWLITGAISQLLTENGGNFQAQTPMVNVFLDRLFLKNNRLKLRLSAYDLLNAAVGVTQSITATSTTQNRVSLLGHYFLVSAIFNLEKFK